MPPTKRPSIPNEHEDNTTVDSEATPASGEVSFTGSARKKIAGSSRTGQACDRCKIRKIRCDARPGGCSPCLQNNTECKTTDRITGRATSRGHTENLENENGSLKMYVVELQEQLRRLGVEPKAAPSVPHGYLPAQSYWSQNEQQQGSWGDLSSSRLVPASSQTERHNSTGLILPEFRSHLAGDNYVGATSGNVWLSPIQGTSLTLFGMKIDLADFLAPEPDLSTSPMSYQTFLKHAFGRSDAAIKPPLPNYDECRIWAEWYFKTIQVHTPIIHKPDFMKLLSRIYHGQYQPSPAETVQVHMVIAIIGFQFAIRNANEEARVNAMTHYHYALSFTRPLLASQKLQDIQALALICLQLRSQPRLGAAWMFAHIVLGLAIELGLHRSANAWQGENAERDPHVIEMRKRVFWSLLTIHMSISGKLGRPMALRLEDFDIEPPEPVPDNLLSESNLSKWQKCSFRAAIHGTKLVKILVQVYATVYSVKAGRAPYETSMRHIEKELQEFRENLVPELQGGPQTVEEDRVPALYLETTQQEIRLLLHHPSLARTASPQLLSDNLDKCLDASGKLLAAATQLKALNGLDATWYYATDYLAAIFTTLFAYTQRQDQMTSADLQRLREDMDAWLDVMGDVGILLGSGTRLRESVRHVIDTSLANISRHLAAKTASAGLTTAGSPTNPTDQSQQQQQMFASSNGYPQDFASAAPTGNLPNPPSQSYPINEPGPDHGQRHNSYSASTHYYPEQQGTMPTYNAPMGTFDNSAYNSADMKPSMDAQLNQPQQQVQPAPATFMTAFQSPTTQNTVGFQPQAVGDLQPGPAAWRHFTDNLNVTGLGVDGSQDYMNSANALMALGGEKQHPGLDLTAVANMHGGMQMSDQQHEQIPWPLVHYDDNQGHGQGHGHGQ